MRFALLAAALGLALCACGPKPTAEPTALPFPTSEFPDINASATDLSEAAATAMEPLDEIAGIKIMTCDAMEALNNPLAGPIYIGMVTSVLKGTPIAGTVTPFSASQRRAMVASLRSLKTPDGKFCGQYDDPGGWE